MESFRTFSSLELVRANACNRYVRYYAFQRNATTSNCPYDGEIASRWDAYLLCDICRHFASVMLHFASLISHNLRCIPAYAHQIPTGFFQSLLNYHRDNLYIIPFFCMMRGPNGGEGCFLCFGLVDMDFRQKCSIFWRRMKKGWGSFSWGSWCDESGISFEFLYYK